ncbi:MAG TPA: PAS domain S-box protein [Syntrophomonadaceae bacterium]|nr:PAS domain S-box protein [Syntrophomonadaceae bacterium]
MMNKSVLENGESLPNGIIFDHSGISYRFDFNKNTAPIDSHLLSSPDFTSKMQQVLAGQPFEETIPDIRNKEGTGGISYLFGIPLVNQNRTEMGMLLNLWVPFTDNNYDHKRLQSLLLGLAHVTEVILDPEVDGYDIYQPLMIRIGRTIGVKFGILYKLETDNTLTVKYELPPGSSEQLYLHKQDINVERLQTEKVIKGWPFEGCIAVPINPSEYTWGVFVAQKSDEPWSSVEIYTIYYLCKIITIIANRAHTQRALLESELRGRILLESQPDMVFTMNTDGYLTFGNSMCTTMTGYPISELINMHITNLIDAEYMPLICDNLAKRIKGEDILPYEIKLINSSGLRIPVELHAAPLKNFHGDTTEVIGVIRDLRERIRLQEELKKNELKYRTYVENTPNVILVMDNRGHIQFVNRQAEILLDYTREKILNRHFSDFVVPEDRNTLIENFNARMEGIGISPAYETEIISSRSIRIPVEIRPNLLHDGKHEVNGLLCIISDITDVKKAKQKLRYLSEHDSLTGIYNRSWFNEEVNNLQQYGICPVGIVMCDINGLKLINDTLGHQAGDRLIQIVGRILRELSNPNYYPARIGGDEFAVILPGVSQEDIEAFLRLFRMEISEFNHNTDGIFLSLAIGNCLRQSTRQSMDMVIQSADNSMYRSKLLEQMSARNTIVRTLTSALTMRDHMTEEHAARLRHLACDFGRRMHLKGEDLDNLSLLAVTHDIGKIGIPDEILFKNGPLDQDEWEIMRSHSEIGYRIAIESRELSGIAEYILYHHEHWNGEGYPVKLKQKQIPLICRILAIIDAHDAMINDRPYRAAMSKQEAVSQLLLDRGKKFDPDLIDSYVKYLMELGEDK